MSRYNGSVRRALIALVLGEIQIHLDDVQVYNDEGRTSIVRPSMKLD
jgi:hypothetical protein